MASRCRSAVAAFRSAAVRSLSTSSTAASLISRSSRPLRNPNIDISSPYIPVNSSSRSLLSPGNSYLRREHVRWYMISRHPSSQLSTQSPVRVSACNYSTQASGASKEGTRKDISKVDDPFDAPTYNIPEKPVTFAEGASYTVVIFAGLGVAALAIYAVFKELIFEPKEYKIFGKALQRVQNDSQVSVRIGSPVTGYGQETRNRTARQRIANRVWKDEDGVEHVEVNFYIRGPHGAGKVFSEMFKDPADKDWKFTYLIVDITSPSHVQLMLESYVPA